MFAEDPADRFYAKFLETRQFLSGGRNVGRIVELSDQIHAAGLPVLSAGACADRSNYPFRKNASSRCDYCDLSGQKMVAENEILSFLDVLYSVTWGQSEWPDIMIRLARLFQASKTCLFETHIKNNHLAAFGDVKSSISDQDLGSSAFIEACTPPRQGQHPYLAFFAGASPRIARLEQIVELDAFRQSAVWNEWMKPRGLDCDIRAVFGKNQSICIHRAIGMPDFTDREINLLGLFLPHLRRVIAAGNSLRRRSLDAILNEASDTPLVVLNRQGKIVRANIAAEDHFALPRSQPSSCNGAPTTVRFELREQLRLLGEAVFRPATIQQPATMAILHMVDGSRFLANAIRIPPEVAEAASGELALVSFRRMRHPATVELAALLKQIFGLPPSHIRLALQLAEGVTLHEAAATCHLSYQSARAYLAAIYAKTDTRHQGELIALVKTIDAERCRRFAFDS